MGSAFDPAARGVYRVAGVAAIVMAQARFDRPAAYVGIATGMFGILAVPGAALIGGLSALVVPTALLTTLWVLAVGIRFLRLARSRTDPSLEPETSAWRDPADERSRVHSRSPRLGPLPVTAWIARWP